MVVVGLEPDRWFMERAGMAGGTRRIALRLWGGRLPDRPREELVRELYGAENQGKPEPSGSQDMIGLIYPGVSRLDYDVRHRRWCLPRPGRIQLRAGHCAAGWKAFSIWCLSISGPKVTTLSGIKNLDPVWIARLGQTGKECYDAIVQCDLQASGRIA